MSRTEGDVSTTALARSSSLTVVDRSPGSFSSRWLLMASPYLRIFAHVGSQSPVEKGGGTLGQCPR